MSRCFLKQQSASQGILWAVFTAMSAPSLGRCSSPSTKAVDPRGTSPSLCCHQHLVLIMPGRKPSSLGCQGSPSSAVFSLGTVSSSRWGWHSRAAFPATCSTPDSSCRGCCLRHISHSSPVFQALANLTPASSLQDVLPVKPCVEWLTLPSPVQAGSFLPCHWLHCSFSPAPGLRLLQLNSACPGGSGTRISVPVPAVTTAGLPWPGSAYKGKANRQKLTEHSCLCPRARFFAQVKPS